MTVEEYQVAQLWSVAEASRKNTGGGEGVEVLSNEPFANKSDLFQNYSSGQYTHKVYKLHSRVPWWIKKIAPKGTLEFHEEAWNAYPFCRTVITNPGYMKDNFLIKIESLHSPEKGTLDNVFNLPPDQLAKREVVYIDIAYDPIPQSDYKVTHFITSLLFVSGSNKVFSSCSQEEEDPTKFQSVKTGRGKLAQNWRNTVTPIMCAYKLVTVEFKWFGFQGRVEKFIQNSERRLFTTFHRQLFCWIDQWYGLTMADIRKLEDEVQKELAREIKHGNIKGMECLDE